MKPRAWEVWVRYSRKKAPWVKYSTTDVLKYAEDTIKRVQGEPLELKIVPLYPRKDEK